MRMKLVEKTLSHHGRWLVSCAGTTCESKRLTSGLAAAMVTVHGCGNTSQVGTLGDIVTTATEFVSTTNIHGSTRVLQNKVML